MINNQTDLFQLEEQDKSPEANSYEIKTCDLSGREFKNTVVKMFTKVRRAAHE
jgi:hypothetical protein